MSSDQLCLGRITGFGPYHINVSLLHGAKGKVEICDISQPYREALDRLVNEEKSVCAFSWPLFV